MGEQAPVGHLRSVLAPLQLELLEVIWTPVARATDGVAGATWPVWDYVARTLHARHADLDDAADVLDSLPRHDGIPAPQRGYPYGLVWRNQHPTVTPGPGEIVGLSIAGLAALADAGKIEAAIADHYAQVIAQVANSEANMEAPPDKVADDARPLSMFTASLRQTIPDRVTARGSTPNTPPCSSTHSTPRPVIR